MRHDVDRRHARHVPPGAAVARAEPAEEAHSAIVRDEPAPRRRAVRVRVYFQAHSAASAGASKAARNRARRAGRSAGLAARNSRPRGPRVYQRGRRDFRRRRELPLGRARRARLRKPAAGRRRAGLALETIAVVNSDDPRKRAPSSRPRTASSSRPQPRFRGRSQRGIEGARGDVLVLSNPDVLVREGALARSRPRRAGPRRGRPGPLPRRGRDAPSAARRGAAPVRARAAAARGERRAAAFRRGLRGRAARGGRGGPRGNAPRPAALSGAFVAVSRRRSSGRPLRRGVRALLRGERLAAAAEGGGGQLSRRRGARRPRVQPERAARAARRRVVRGLRAAVLQDALRRPRARRPSTLWPPSPAVPRRRRSRVASCSSSRRPPPSRSRRSRTSARSRSSPVGRRVAAARRRARGFGGAAWFARAVDPVSVQVLAEAALG